MNFYFVVQISPRRHYPGPDGHADIGVRPPPPPLTPTGGGGDGGPPPTLDVRPAGPRRLSPRSPRDLPPFTPLPPSIFTPSLACDTQVAPPERAFRSRDATDAPRGPNMYINAAIPSCSVRREFGGNFHPYRFCARARTAFR